VNGGPPLLFPPPGRPALTRRQRILARVAGGAGMLIVIVSAIGLTGALAGGSTAGRGDTYVWRSGPAVFLNNGSDLEDASCALAGPARNRWITLHKRPNSVFENFQTNGGRVNRFESGSIRISCDHDVAISSGPIVWLYPVAATPYPFLIGLVLAAFWFIRLGGTGPASSSAPANVRCCRPPAPDRYARTVSREKRPTLGNRTAQPEQRRCRKGADLRSPTTTTSGHEMARRQTALRGYKSETRGERLW
jgi:hypothetical protein